MLPSDLIFYDFQRTVHYSAHTTKHTNTNKHEKICLISLLVSRRGAAILHTKSCFMWFFMLFLFPLKVER